MKSPLLIVGAAGAVFLTSCAPTTTLENRRDLYCPANYFANGPYTRMLKDGIPAPKPVSGTAPAGSGDFKNVVGK
ncbi:MAG TPA: hypothetical protein PLS03_11490 [Terrimicrobiaceae bacterium]|nr:hypothetical protein [Terrimicrobiaceae bacterium]